MPADLDTPVEKTVADGLVATSTALELATLLEETQAGMIDLPTQQSIARYLRYTAQCVESLTTIVECWPLIVAKLKPPPATACISHSCPRLLNSTRP